MLKNRIVSCLGILIFSLCSLAGVPVKPTKYEIWCTQFVQSAGKKTDAVRFHEFLKTTWDHTMHENPEWATWVGYPGLNHLWDDVSLEHIAQEKREMDSTKKALESIKPAKLSPQDQISYRVFKFKLDRGIESRKFGNEYLGMSHMGGVQKDPPELIESAPANNIHDYEDILSRLRSFGTMVDQNIALLQEGIKLKITQPKFLMEKTPEQILSQIPDDPAQATILKPFQKFPDSISAADQEKLKKSAVEAYRNQIVPAYKRLHTFIVGTYIPACRESIGLSELPQGREWYVSRAKHSTTTETTPDEIHEIGLKEVARIKKEMLDLKAASGFKGTLEEFNEFLRTDKRFFFDSADDLVAKYRDIAKRIDPELSTQFKTLPRLTYGVKPVPAYSEKSQPTAYYNGGSALTGRPGYFYANTYNLKSRPKWEMEALTLHEAVPGHHLQISIAQEAGELPDFRKHGGFTAYVEGWGLYAESLGKDLGLYKDVYSDYGRLTYEMWRAVRLVVDTGIHSKHWTRQQAIDFFTANTSKTANDVGVEVDRYIVWPGQALAYKMGELEFKRLKALAKEKLGDGFDVRAFHDQILLSGALPLGMVSEKVEAWIKTELANKKKVKTKNSVF